MAYLHILNFSFGMDRRRPQAVGVPGTLWTAQNVFIGRGGDIERAKKLVAVHTLPANTLGLGGVNQQLYVFGSATTPAGMPIGVQYQQLAGPGSATMVAVLDVKTFDGKFYVIAEYSDGGIYHYYDGAQVTDWNTLSDANSGFAQVAAALAVKIDANAGVTAVASATGVIITAAVPGVTFTSATAVTDNGGASTPTATATELVANVAEVVEVLATGEVEILSGASGNSITQVTVNAVPLLLVPVAWAGTVAATATALVVEINNNTATHTYSAEAALGVVTITAQAGTGATPNGYVVAATTAGMSATDTNMADGVAYVAPVARVVRVVIGGGTFDAVDLWKITINGTLYQITGRGAGAGTSAFVLKGRVYVVANSLVRYCVLGDATDWTTTTDPATDSGFINIATDAEGAQHLVGMALYSGNVAVFAEDVVPIYSIFADAEDNVLVERIEQTGALAARTLMPHGNIDVFYLDATGIRSLRPREGTSAAFVSDVGSAIDSFVQEWMDLVDETTLSRSVSVVDPVSGRFLLAIGSRIFGLSYFPSSRITAWSYLDVGFTVSDLLRVGRRVYARSGNSIYLYGGLDGGTYPAAAEQNAVVTLPFMSANDPAGIKSLTAFDMVSEGEWLVEVLIDPNDVTKKISLGRVTKITSNQLAHKLAGVAAIFGMQFTADKAGYASISSIQIHYEKGEAT